MRDAPDDDPVVAPVGDVMELAVERRQRAVQAAVAVGDSVPAGTPAGEALGKRALLSVQHVDDEAARVQQRGQGERLVAQADEQQRRGGGGTPARGWAA